mmetsp:Transcript_658/g.1321  ORF Transcript_658/g.1321 Transcript_658/m.1321 type:complete len:208 (-) Transcript_658:80-703(-)|eukprot:CAMPEP_0113306924 /NCGR_PEP_ID=MMETSP0010_2-20120614/5985_1 /TAXON_ID=216773 ORGANISM="Corethron hystrix, Strain 308" /NCGR_SAMPLE_ID=MMETSP0010_2 /ASSEMBLY_ACC=CAM_ASM_000155 /LENGTH=207 /DNA_ID=CAMNT_0000161697 /DNA_START=504 /DNA_END=1127 /DNA_ORIENTATION=- /assembly_acc=CAM_ASM_000155
MSKGTMRKMAALALASAATTPFPSTDAFVPPPSYLSHPSPNRLSLFEDDDISDFNALCQFGPAPFVVRLTDREKFWRSVDDFQAKEGCSRVVAVRNMDAFFSDPNGWVLARDRAEKYGEVKDYTKKSGVQKRPVFSFFWTCLVVWFFFSFLPTRIGELGVHPSAFQGGFCPPDVRIIDENGRESFECKKIRSEQSFPFNAMVKPGDF